MNRTIPFTKEQIIELKKAYSTPFHIYDEKGIRENAKKLYKAFDWIPGFKNYFAVKACPNAHIMKILKEEGMGMDCSSLPELLLSEKVGISGEDIMFTSNDTPADEFMKAKKLGAIINLDDISHIDFLNKTIGKMPELICFRYNPGPARVANSVIGNPVEAKYGFTKEHLFEGYRKCRDLGVKRFGLHTMVASNELNPAFFVDTATALMELVVEINEKLGIRIEFINLGGGIGIPYKPEHKAVNLDFVSKGVKEAYERLIVKNDLDPLRIVMENGRMVTGPFGYLVSEVLHKKSIYKDYVGLDACMANLMRPALYGAYHHITVIGKEKQALTHKYDVTGSLCENNDKFAIDRMLPEIRIGDIIIIHEAGAHGHAMGFNYNGKLRSAEFLLKKDGSFEMIRRAETVDDYFSTQKFDTL